MLFYTDWNKFTRNLEITEIIRLSCKIQNIQNLSDIFVGSQNNVDKSNLFVTRIFWAFENSQIH